MGHDNFHFIEILDFTVKLSFLMDEKMTCDILVDPLPLECHVLFERPLMY